MTEIETESTKDFSKCGVDYCPAGYYTNTEITTPAPTNTTEIESKEDNDENFSITLEQRYILAGVYLICSILSAVIVCLFVDPLSRYKTVFI